MCGSSACPELSSMSNFSSSPNFSRLQTNSRMAEEALLGLPFDIVQLVVQYVDIVVDTNMPEILNIRFFLGRSYAVQLSLSALCEPLLPRLRKTTASISSDSTVWESRCYRSFVLQKATISKYLQIFEKSCTFYYFLPHGQMKESLFDTRYWV